MSRTRITVEMIDADGCTFNKYYRQRILFFIRAYQAILDEYGVKPSYTEGEQALLAIFVSKALEEQKKFSIKKAELRELTEYSNHEAKLYYLMKKIDDGHNEWDLDDLVSRCSESFLLNNYVYHYIQLMEKVCPAVLRAIYVLSNTQLIHEITSDSYKTNQTIVMLGSNRQAQIYDQVNMESKGTASIYPELPHLVKYINLSLMDNKIKLDKATLADAYEKDEFKPGKSYKKILKHADDYAKNAFDGSKVNIIYFAAHHIARKFPEKHITINLFDDQTGILEGLKKFYIKRSELLPKNVQLNLYRYDGKFTSSFVVFGSGVIDYNYEKNVRLMAAMCGYDPEKNAGDIVISTTLDVKEFLQRRITGWECVMYQADNQITLFKKPRKSHSSRKTEVVQTFPPQ